MTRIDFYTEVDDKLAFACRIAQKAISQQLKVVVLADDEATLAAASDRLWRVPTTGFTPNCRAGSALADRTPIVLACPGEVLPHDQVLVNLGTDRPEHFARFERLAEVVARDETDRQQARARYRFYRDRGYSIDTHRMSETARD
jgi:DNA polymerase-3 subunit chi